MILRIVKKVVFWGVVVAVGGWLLVGSELGSYVRSSARAMRSSFKSSVPVDFQIKRARDLLDETGPEMQANIRLIAQQEVEIAQLKSDLASSDNALTDQQARVRKLREMLASGQSEYRVQGLTYSREQLKEELSRSFDRYREAEAAMAAKRRLLDGREKSLVASVQALDRVRSQQGSLENQIAALEAQNRLVQVAGSGSQVSLDTSKLAQAEKLLSDVKKQLDISERVLAYDAKFTKPIPIDTIDEKGLLSAIDNHFSAPTTRPALARADRQ
jgi:chromosome segregation ATPase